MFQSNARRSSSVADDLDTYFNYGLHLQTYRYRDSPHGARAGMVFSTNGPSFRMPIHNDPSHAQGVPPLGDLFWIFRTNSLQQRRLRGLALSTSHRPSPGSHLRCSPPLLQGRGRRRKPHADYPRPDEHRYRVTENGRSLPDGWNLTDVASVAVDSKDRIYVFNRGAHPMVVLDREGNFITSWAKACSTARMGCTSMPTTNLLHR